MDKEIIKEMRQAIKKGDLALIKELLNSNEGLLRVVTSFGSWLHDAASYGKYEVAQYFIEEGIDVNICGGVDDCGAITTAAFEGYLDIVKLLHDNGAILDVSDSTCNPLFAAIYNGHFDIVQFLVECGIDITVCYSMGELECVDAHEYARQYGETEIADYIEKKLKELKNMDKN